MIERFIGKKSAILKDLLAMVAGYAEPGEHVVDIFSGSMTVSLAFKQAGYRVTANDINLFSAILGQAYLLPDEPPSVDLALLVADPESLRGEARALLHHLRRNEGYATLANPDHMASYTDTTAAILHLNKVTAADLPARERRTHFFDTYTEAGTYSAFVSSRGRKGRRRFFTPANGQKIDLVMNQLRAWRRADVLPDDAYALLLAATMRAVEKVANTQGTFHDFPREEWDSRALRPIELQAPAPDAFLGTASGHRVGRERDSLEFVSEIDPHAVLYIDPPYNFRQYTAYYFLLNVLCRYPELDDPDDYFAGVTYVRGQNPEDDFVSTFCKPARFIEDMSTLIERAAADAVVISYFTGRNHWSKFDLGPDDTGRDLLCGLLSGNLFEPGTLTIAEIDRRNYASYGGYRARQVQELLLGARKRQEGSDEARRRTGGRLRTVA